MPPLPRVASAPRTLAVLWEGRGPGAALTQFWALPAPWARLSVAGLASRVDLAFLWIFVYAAIL